LTLTDRDEYFCTGAAVLIGTAMLVGTLCCRTSAARWNSQQAFYVPIGHRRQKEPAFLEQAMALKLREDLRTILASIDQKRPGSCQMSVSNPHRRWQAKSLCVQRWGSPKTSVPQQRGSDAR
jgi:hypothetical protein